MSYFIEFIVISAVLGLFVSLLIAPFAMLALGIIIVATAAAAVALVVGIVVAPFFAVRALHRRFAGRHHEIAEDHAYAAAHVTLGSAS